ncbi:hypothetical protein [Sphingomonas spermidinifaciens]|uniref:hypothetical protein n=1 Tax=Sphingomonas spermidinifaciens TaxID=1141889 RepID=UPI001141C37B|nr:hypothetical protein [Sphingomonas spermidinifaciens]
MEQALIRKLKPGMLAAYRALASGCVSSRKTELRCVIEATAPFAKKNPCDADGAFRSRVAGGCELPTALTIHHDRVSKAGRLDGVMLVIDAGNADGGRSQSRARRLFVSYARD